MTLCTLNEVPLLHFVPSNFHQKRSLCTKVGIITIGTWYKALWSPNLIQNHNKKVFHTSFEIHLFLGNVPPLQCITELPDDSNSQKKDKYYFFWPKLDQNVQLYQKMVEHHHFPISFKYSNPGAYITYLMLLYLPWRNQW